MVEELMGDYGTRFFIAVFGVGLGLLCLVGVLLLMRRRSGPSPFLRGGKNRQPRLQVLDAAAVDARRRIVLVRRDNVEHLVMIGGPTDIVIESGIQGASHAVSLQPAPSETERLAAPVEEPRLQAPARQAQLTAPLPAREALGVVTPEPAAAPVSTPASTPDMRRPDPAAPAQVKSQATVPATERPAPMVAAVNAAQPERPAAQPQPAAPIPVGAPVETAEARPVAAPALSSGIAGSEIGAAADALDAARRRVFQPALDRTPAAPPAQAPAAEPLASKPASTPASSPKARPLGSDFDRILEEEMANNLASVDPEPAMPRPAGASLPRRDPAAPRVTGATPEPSLQNEIARIFGEMSVTRDERQP
jgi:hypothetical protein